LEDKEVEGRKISRHFLKTQAGRVWIGSNCQSTEIDTVTINTNLLLHLSLYLSSITCFRRQFITQKLPSKTGYRSKDKGRDGSDKKARKKT
jgi:hypothetical protein